jgi:hypothetical protein
MTIEDFIEEHREEIDVTIHRMVTGSLDDEERESWIMNDEGLYDWAIDEGVEGI